MHTSGVLTTPCLVYPTAPASLDCYRVSTSGLGGSTKATTTSKEYVETTSFFSFLSYFSLSLSSLVRSLSSPSFSTS